MMPEAGDIPMLIQLRLWQQQPCKAVIQALQDNNTALNPDAQDLVIQALSNQLCRAAPPNPQYIKRLLKTLLQAVEEQGSELGEQPMQLYTGVLMLQDCDECAEADDASWRYKTFYYSSAPSWQQLQQLQQVHPPCCCSQATLCQQGTESHQQMLPLSFAQRLQRRQQLLSDLLAAAGVSSGDTEAVSSKECFGERKVSAANASPHSDHHHHQQQQQQECCSHLMLQQCQQPHRVLCKQEVVQQKQYSPQQQQQQQKMLTPCQAGLLSLHVSDNLFEGGTGCHMWGAGYLLAEFVLNNQQLFAGCSCLEIGCGPGLVATCLCRIGTQQLLLTDGDPQTLVNCVANLQLNGHRNVELVGSWQQAVKQLQEKADGQQVFACPLDWHDDVPGLHADVIVGSDIAYDPAAVPSLVRLLQQLLQAQQQASSSTVGSNSSSHTVNTCCAQPVAYLSTTKRHPDTLKLFIGLAADAGLDVRVLPLEPQQYRGRLGLHNNEQPVILFQELPALVDRTKYILHRVTRLEG